MKLWPTTTKNKCFVKMLWHLLGERIKAIVFLVCSSGTVATEFFFFLFFFSLPFVLFFLLNIYNNSHIYCYTDTTNFSGYAATVFRHCALNVFALCKHCSGNSALVRHFAFFFFNSSYIPSSTVATVVTIFFFPSVCTFFFSFYIYCFTTQQISQYFYNY